MTGPTISPKSAPYFQVAQTHWLLVPTIVDITAPTLVELQAGTDITNDVVALTGFTKTANILTVDRASDLVSDTLPGRSAWDASSLTLVADKDGTDLRGSFTEGASTHIVKLEDNFGTSSVMSTYAVRISTINQPADLTAAATFTVNMTITDASEGDTVPAS